MLILALLQAAAPDFQRDVRPILAEHCFTCHGPDAATREADLRLDRRDDALADRGGYAAIVPHDADDSELLLRVTDPVDPMPPPDVDEALDPGDVATLRAWIDAGAAWDEHWAFVPPRRPDPPAVADEDWVRGPVDRFVLARLEREGLAPSPRADDVTLVRRLHQDLLGLPPDPERVDAYLADDRPDRYERLVDELLASPHHAERLTQHWLDLVRYGDSGGYHSDNPIPIWPYRDWVIDAFARNVPFDVFTVEQLAGDLLEEPTTAQRVATGYNRLNKTTEEGGAQPGEYLHKYMADRVRTTAGVWLGLTMGCAECHDHKYDPLSQSEFYAFGAFFADVEEVGVYEHMGSRRPPVLRLPDPETDARLASLDAAIDAAEGDERERLEKERRAVERSAPRTLVTRAVEPRPIRVLARGNWLDDSGPLVKPDTPAALPPLGVDGRRATRLDLARWLVRPDHPLTARVFANRLWAMFFGEGLSARLDDLGVQGEPPVHPELLDWLAVEFVESGWDVRHVVRLLVTSSAYRQSSLHPAELRALDPENRLVARQSRWRLDAEFVRDSALAASGLLERRVGGPSVFPYQPAGYWDQLNFPKRTWRNSEGADQHRRGLYTHWQRTFPHPSLVAFDAPSREECTAERARSNTPLAALALLNDPTYVEAAEALGDRARALPAEGDRARIAWAFRRAVARTPTDEELDVLFGLLERHRASYGAERPAWTSVARAILNLHETITRS